MPQRLSFEESWKFLHGLGAVEINQAPPLPVRPPQEADGREEWGLRFFRTCLLESRFENLTLPRTFICRSEVAGLTFKGTDLSESTFCWNDFNNVDFSGSDLSRCDLRASRFSETTFSGATLRNADLRRSCFEACDFSNADMLGARLTDEQGKDIVLTTKQREDIDWCEEGAEPPGG